MPQPRLPRLQVAMSPEMEKTFHEYAEAQDMATATAVRELLSEMLPHIQQLTAALIRAKEQPQEALEDMRDFFVESQANIAQANLDLNTQIRKKRRAKK